MTQQLRRTPPANAFFLGDVVEVNPYWPQDYPDTHWDGRIRDLGREAVLVDALRHPDDEEMWLPYGALTFKERPR